ncbi:glutamate--cysteine ligase [Thiocystis violascens]|uniref:Glutamate--cysteine ligase n=1 Tax=Thiocystis violascens (strain ATCC 17096 / DSM 198 / 6111) TaxID=765911 RepID=I3YE20_THIV6|nr:glutamate--cysteine ligase [Thiocystis violascens]AFL75238.1 glutamate-cysteine ligase [Thiocystis violascens DSM 198]
MNDSQATLERRIARLAAAGGSATFAGNRIGLEKEGLRVSANGGLAETPHPSALGAALTHPYITTDFSEALIELITPPLSSGQAALEFLKDIHCYVYRHLPDELLWGTSMPCILSRAGEIPLAQYGTSNAATMKTAYRRGLGNRYGRTMQLIAGVHFNFSFADAFWDLYQDQEAVAGERVGFRAEAQMGMIRNLQRIGWLVPYLFGASPAVCASFVQGRETDLQHFDADTLFDPHATSLRMGDIGYQNKQEEGTGIKANYDSLDAYVRSLTWAIQTPCPQYEAIGVKVGDRYEQLNANVLQIENEYYSTVRPKQITDWMEKPTLALRRRGIRYIELRSLDVNIFEPVGVGDEQLLFLDGLMLYCLLLGSPRIGARERRDIDENQVLTAHRGREPGLALVRDRHPVTLRQWAGEILAGMAAAAELLDGAANGPRSENLRRQQEKVDHPDLTPSARILETMRERREGFFAFSQRLAEEHRRDLRSSELSPERQALFDRLAVDSLRQQREIEAADDRSFDDFLDAYFAQGH